MCMPGEQTNTCGTDFWTSDSRPAVSLHSSTEAANLPRSWPHGRVGQHQKESPSCSGLYTKWRKYTTNAEEKSFPACAVAVPQGEVGSRPPENSHFPQPVIMPNLVKWMARVTRTRGYTEDIWKLYNCITRACTLCLKINLPFLFFE